MLITGGRVINPATNTDAVLDIRCNDGKICEIGCDLAAESDEEVFDASGKIVMPGLIDMHVHFRDPGQTHKGDIATESAAAARGGFTTVLAMPNTTPVADNPEIVKYVHDKAVEVGLTRVFQVGSVTKGMAGAEVSDISGMKSAGIIAISEDGKSVMNSEVYREAMEIAVAEDLTILAHCEDINLVHGGVMNKGAKSAEMGMGGISNAVENIIEVRDIMLAEETGARLHLCHCSTKESYEIIRDAKAKGIKVSGEVCPHHFTLTEDDIVANDGNYKMNPPLRSKEDREWLRRGIKDGIFEVISTDHAPHADEEKAKGFAGPFGIIGLETSVALTYSELVMGGELDLMGMARCMSYNPACILGLKDSGNLSVGCRADITVIDIDEEYEIKASEFAGKSKNMPYEGRKVKGRVVLTVLEGKTTYKF